MLMLCACLPAVVHASPAVTLRTSFAPNKLGASTTIAFGFQILTPSGETPTPLTSLNLHLPAGMGLAATTLGQANCEPAALIAHGLDGCSPNARLGYGEASIEVPLGPVIVHETAKITVFVGPVSGQNTQVLFYAEGWRPIFAQLVFPGQMLPDAAPFGGRIETAVPLVPTVPDAADATVIRFQSTIGPSHLTYYKRVNGQLVPYRPAGVAIPRVCPPGGFPFAADFGFHDGSSVSATSSVACPAAHASARGRSRGRRSQRTHARHKRSALRSHTT
ncbi:MAG TPA: hypothetical protein VLJ42_01560 [Solirubrobacteraceae bacterium]|nr:hypothetical protein [Solirubrobacteraceae bacterium]